MLPTEKTHIEIRNEKVDLKLFKITEEMQEEQF